MKSLFILWLIFFTNLAQVNAADFYGQLEFNLSYKELDSPDTFQVGESLKAEVTLTQGACVILLVAGDRLPCFIAPSTFVNADAIIIEPEQALLIFKKIGMGESELTALGFTRRTYPFEVVILNTKPATAKQFLTTAFTRKDDFSRIYELAVSSLIRP